MIDCDKCPERFGCWTGHSIFLLRADKKNNSVLCYNGDRHVGTISEAKDGDFIFTDMEKAEQKRDGLTEVYGKEYTYRLEIGARCKVFAKYDRADPNS